VTSEQVAVVTETPESPRLDSPDRETAGRNWNGDASEEDEASRRVNGHFHLPGDKVSLMVSIRAQSAALPTELMNILTGGGWGQNGV
jgi:hypothetical protein